MGNNGAILEIKEPLMLNSLKQIDRAKKDKRNAAARNRGAALRGVGMKRTADGWV